jgi:hypothetical protein
MPHGSLGADREPASHSLPTGHENPQVSGCICARICARDETGRVETRQTQQVGRNRPSRFGRGQRRDQRRAETPETPVVLLRYQRHHLDPASPPCRHGLEGALAVTLPAARARSPHSVADLDTPVRHVGVIDPVMRQDRPESDGSRPTPSSDPGWQGSTWTSAGEGGRGFREGRFRGDISLRCLPSVHSSGMRMVRGPGSRRNGWRNPGRIRGHPATVRNDRFCLYPRCAERVRDASARPESGAASMV